MWAGGCGSGGGGRLSNCDSWRLDSVDFTVRLEPDNQCYNGS